MSKTWIYARTPMCATLMGKFICLLLHRLRYQPRLRLLLLLGIEYHLNDFVFRTLCLASDWLSGWKELISCGPPDIWIALCQMEKATKCATVTEPFGEMYSTERVEWVTARDRYTYISIESIHFKYLSFQVAHHVLHRETLADLHSSFLSYCEFHFRHLAVVTQRAARSQAKTISLLHVKRYIGWHRVDVIYYQTWVRHKTCSHLSVA